MTDLNKFFDLSAYGKAFNMEAAMEANKKNLETFKKANAILAEGASAVAARQLELTQNAIEENIEAARTLATAKGVEEFSAKQNDMLRTSFEKGVENATEIFNIAKKAQTDASELVNKQVAENTELFSKEAKKAAEAAAPAAKK